MRTEFDALAMRAAMRAGGVSYQDRTDRLFREIAELLDDVNPAIRQQVGQKLTELGVVFTLGGRLYHKRGVMDGYELALKENATPTSPEN